VARRRVAAARCGAVHELRARAIPSPPPGAELVGLPTPERAAALLAGLDQALWQQA